MDKYATSARPDHLEVNPDRRLRNLEESKDYRLPSPPGLISNLLLEDS